MDNTKPIISPPPKPHQNKLRKTLSKRGFLSPSSFKIGQLDGSAPRRREIRVVKRRASIELIAEQYQAILESRDFRDEAAEAAPVNESEHERPSTPDWWQHQSHHNHSPRHSPPRQGSPQNHSPRHHSPPRQASPRYDGRSSQEDTLERLSPTRFDPSAADRSREVVLDMPARPPGPPNLSPASDGTLVAFEEDAIYFKPISFSSPEPSPTPDRQSFEDKPLPMTPPQQRRQQHRQPQQQPRSQSQHKTRSRATSQSDQPGNALQTCIAMLVRELTTSMPAQQKQVSAQQLQVETMIEAYERLRDQAVMGVGAGDAEQQRAVRSMFDCWLAALHTMHRGFARRGSDQEIMAEDVD